MKTAATALLLIAIIAVWSAAREAQTFSGTITDNACDRADHSRMRMGPTDAECVVACVDAHGAAFVLFDGGSTYALSGGEKLDSFAGQRVNVVGVLDAKTRTISVSSIAAAP